MDADIYGPSVPIMMGIGDIDPQTTPFPIDKHGLQVMSMGFLVGPDKAAILRGPMVQRYLQSFLTQIDWGRLDYLVIDLPPGTGDAQLTLTQTAPVAGTVDRDDAAGRQPDRGAGAAWRCSGRCRCRCWASSRT